VGGPSYTQSNGKVEIVDNRAETVERLAQLIFAGWIDSQSDSGSTWRQSLPALKAAKQEAGEELVAEAMQVARARYEKLRG
jgi:hypothetical protein